MQSITKRTYGTFVALMLGTLLSTGFYAGCSDSTTDNHVDVCAHWEYTAGEAGPDHWKDCATNAACGGQSQSPVNISGALADTSLKDINIGYSSSMINILNNGHMLQWAYDGGSMITFNGLSYDLLQFHFHTPSEHTINGVAAAMEVHLVHKNAASGNLAVIGVMVTEGAENPLLQRFISHLPAAKDSTFHSDSTFIASDLLPTDLSYFTYPGSLTTPPCSEIVRWLVLQNSITASHDQIHAMETLMHINNRPLQPLNGRKVLQH